MPIQRGMNVPKRRAEVSTYLSLGDPALPPVSELLSSSCHDFGDDGRAVSAPSTASGGRHLGFLVVLLDPNLDCGQERTTLLLTLFDTTFRLCSNTGSVAHTMDHTGHSRLASHLGGH